MKLAKRKPQHFLWEVSNRIATLRLNRPERKNPLTFDSYAELRDLFRDLVYADDVDVVIFAPNGGNFCSGGDVHDIIGPLIGLPMKELLAFTRMTGDLVKAMIHCGKPIIAAVDGVAVGAGSLRDTRTCTFTKRVPRGSRSSPVASPQEKLSPTSQGRCVWVNPSRSVSSQVNQSRPCNRVGSESKAEMEMPTAKASPDCGAISRNQAEAFKVAFPVSINAW